MRLSLLILIGMASTAGLIGLTLIRGEAGRAAPPKDVAAATFWPDRVAANGLVEGARPEVALRPEVAGILKAVLAHENQDVRRDELLAELSNATQEEAVALAAAELDAARAQLDRLRNGERAEKRRALAAVEEAKKAVYLLAKSDYDRTHKLAEARSASREQGERDYFAMLQARAEWEQSAAERALVEAPARADELAAAEARVDMAEARLRLARAELAKTRLRAPSDGRVLHVYAEPGEVSGPNTGRPVFLIADLSRRRVRAFIEELDAARVQVGQRAVVTADGLPGREFPGTVSLTLPRMGRRGPTTDAASEYHDVYFREVLIDLDAGDALPLNLRVQVRITVKSGRGS